LQAIKKSAKIFAPFIADKAIKKRKTIELANTMNSASQKGES
jgi:hypothetical protein